MNHTGLARLTALLLSLALALSLGACGGAGREEPAPLSSQVSSQPAAESGTEESSAASGVEASESQEASEGSQSPASSQAPAAASSESGVEDDGQLNENGRYNTLDGFLSSDLMQQQLADMKAQLGDGNGMSLDLKSEGEKLIYVFTYESAALEGVDESALAPALEEALDGMASVFQSIAGSLAEAVEITDPKVVVTYQKDDGTVYCSREFSARE